MTEQFRDKRHKIWAAQVKSDGGYKCCVCGKSNTYLHSHHKNSFDLYEADRYNANNGVILCQEHHFLLHSIYGAGGNTAAQFEEFQKIIKIIEAIAKDNLIKKGVEPSKKEEQDNKYDKRNTNL